MALNIASPGANHHAPQVLTIATGSASLGARPSRSSATFYAPVANVADIVVETSGFHIAPGGTLTVTATDAYAFTGTNGDTLQVFEEYD